MLFITNRALKQSPRSRRNRSISFDLSNNAPSNSVFFCERVSKDIYREVGSQVFMGALKKSRAQQILLYIHGFSNMPEADIFKRTEELQRLFNGREENFVEVVPLIWPCDNDIGIVKDYWDDQKSADMSAFAFSRAFNKFMEWRDSYTGNNACRKRINMLAHSMGNRVLRETLRVWNEYDLGKGVPLLFRNTFLVAADIVNESLERGHSGEFICDASRNVSVYYASDDLALRASKISNLKNCIASRRLGHSGPEDMKKVPGNVFTLDCDDFNTRYDTLKGHTYFLGNTEGKPGRVFQHMYRAMKTGRVPMTILGNKMDLL